MALAGAYTGEDELDTVMDDIEAATGGNPAIIVDDAEEAVFMGLLAAVCQGAVEAQASTNATRRFSEAFGAHTVMLVNQIATLAPFVRAEILAVSTGLTVAELKAAEGDAHDWVNLGPIH